MIAHITPEQIAQVMKKVNIPFNEESLFSLKRSKFQKELIDELSKNYILVPVLQVSALNIILHAKFELTFPKHKKSELAKRAPFSCDGFKTKWHLISKNLHTNVNFDETKVSSPLRVILYVLFLLRELQICNHEICKKDIYLPKIALIKKHLNTLTISDYDGDNRKLPNIIIP